MPVRIIILTLGLPAYAMMLQQDPSLAGYVDVTQCPRNVTTNMYGVWIDGRDAQRGPDAYGGDAYNLPMQRALQSVYDFGSDGPDANLDIFKTIVDIVRPGEYRTKWRVFKNPNGLEVRACHKFMPVEVLNKLMSTVTVVDKDFNQVYAVAGSTTPVDEHGGSGLTNEQFFDMLAYLFSTHSQEVSGKPGRHAELVSIAKLLQNIAFLHPLGDQNGRSRLLLLQYMIRQRHLGCGTMMFNNNKNIYMESAENYAELLEESMEIYSKASEVAFAENPWQTNATQISHRDRFPRARYRQKCEHHWQRKGFGNVGTSTNSRTSALAP